MKSPVLLVFILFLVGIGIPSWALYCPGCGAEAGDDARFCARCGVSLATEGLTSSPTVVSPLVFRDSTASPTSLVQPPTPQAFQVTTRYLLVNGYRVERGSLFWVAEVSGDRARVWCLNDPPMYGYIMGWVALSELEKRSSWKPGTPFYCVEPPPPTAEIVVIRERPYWRHWHPRPYYYRMPGPGPRHGGPRRRHH